MWPQNGRQREGPTRLPTLCDLHRTPFQGHSKLAAPGGGAGGSQRNEALPCLLPPPGLPVARPNEDLMKFTGTFTQGPDQGARGGGSSGGVERRQSLGLGVAGSFCPLRPITLARKRTPHPVRGRRAEQSADGLSIQVRRVQLERGRDVDETGKLASV